MLNIKKNLLLLLAPLLFLNCSKSAKNIEAVDICIYGGTSAGVIAAYTASKNGKNVLLIEPGNHLGGMSSGGLGYTDIGNKFVVQGLARDFYRRLGTHYGRLEQWVFEPSVAENIFKDYIQRGKIRVLYNYRLQQIEKTGASIVKIVIENSQKPESATNKTVQARVFIDCSYEGDLMAKAGVSYVVGREDNSTYNETWNGVQLLNGHQFWDPIDPYVIRGDSSSGLIWGVSNNPLLLSGSGDKKVQAYNFRVCLTNDPDNLIPISLPDNYDPKRYELALRLHEVSPRKSLYDFFIWSRMPNSKTDINNAGGFSTDMIGMNWDYPEADYARRAEIWKAHEDYTKGFFYFLGHDERVPEYIRKEMLQWGYPKDEYTDNNHWSHQLYIREARRMVGELVMTQHHCTGDEVVDDFVAWAAYTMDSHNCDRLVVNGCVKNEGNVEVGGFPPYPVSYRAIVPKKNEITNLLVPVCLSASHIAYGSIRMEPVFMVLAQSASVAACLAIDNHIAVQDIDVRQLQQELKINPLADGSHPEILIDNDDTKFVSLTGNWSYNRDTYRSYGLNFFVDDSGGKILKSAKYAPEIHTAGNYRIYIYYPKLDEGSTYTSVTVFNGKDTVEKQINRNDIKIEGQTGGEWIDLGLYHLEKGTENFVEISNKGADNVIAADAVLFIPFD
ncbi:MAG: FAD-dependent oxidoreductase [Dysgonamonadaceae bacterium]|jgi:ribulose 1,5-bisphosphate synthetase/thiazole synthase|nr:FAD-dependent oxidoreductase [Dysgonamonadaceae bacterium]